MMFRAIVRRELLSHLRSLRFSTSFVLCFVMMIASIHLLAEKQEDDIGQAKADGGVQAEPGQWNTQSLSALSGEGPMVYRRKPALRVLCAGLGDEMSLTTYTPTNDQPRYRHAREFLHNPVSILFPAIDFCLIVGIIASLIAIVFTDDLITGEKQNGTLKLMLANSVPRHHVLSAKWLGSFLSFLIGYVPGLLIVLIYMELHPGIPLNAGDYVSILVIYLLSILYAACFFSLGLFVSCRCSDSRTSLLVLLMLWTLLTLIIPSFSAYLGAMLRPVPPPFEIGQQVRLVQREARARTMEKLELYKSQHNAAQSQENSEETRAFMNQLFREEIRNTHRDTASIRNSYTQKLYHQVQSSKTISCISPFSSFVYMATDLCHTGLLGNWHFRRSVDRFQKKFISYIDESLATDSINDPPNLETFPAFKYYENDISEIIQLNWLHLVLLALYPVIFFLAAHFSFLKYDVR